MKRFTVQELQAQLPALFQQKDSADFVVVTEGSKPVGLLVWLANQHVAEDASLEVVWEESGTKFELRQGSEQPRPQFGRCQGMLSLVSEDDDHLGDFEEYMQ